VRIFFAGKREMRAPFVDEHDMTRVHVRERLRDAALTSLTTQYAQGLALLKCSRRVCNVVVVRKPRIGDNSARNAAVMRA
jgi:hypothetical protein